MKHLQRSVITAVMALAGVALAANGAGKQGQQQGMQQNQWSMHHVQLRQGSDLTSNGAQTLWLLHQVNQSEIRFGQLAQSKSQNSQVKDLGNTLMKDHQDLDEKVTSFANDHKVSFNQMMGVGGAGQAGMGQNSQQGNSQQSGQAQSQQAKTVAIPGAFRHLTQRDQHQYQKLQGLSGNQFDRRFLTDTMRDHQHVIGVLNRELPKLKNDDLKNLTQNAISTMRKHEDQARNLLQSTQRQARPSPRK